MITKKNAIEDEVGPEHRPLTLNILKQLELSGIVVQPRRILVRKIKSLNTFSCKNNITNMCIIH